MATPPQTQRTAGLRDQLDRDLLALLQANARTSTADLARQLGTARTTVLARLARLEREGVIAGYTLRLGQDVLDEMGNFDGVVKTTTSVALE